jgi:Tfp pilus assembly protein PilN
MNKFLALLMILMLPISFFGQPLADSLLHDLDQTVKEYQFYLNQKEASIQKLKESLKHPSSAIQKYKIYKKLYTEYKAYQSDSALTYSRKSLQITQKLKNQHTINEAKLNVASIMGTLGMYKESLDLLETINIHLTPNLKGDYHWTNRIIYGYLNDYATSTQEKKKYTILTKKYRDSSMLYFSKKSRKFSIANSDQLIERGHYNQAIQSLLLFFSKTIKQDPDYAVIAYIISDAYRLKKDKIQEKKWLIISAISDLQLVKKENISLRKLAFIHYEEGEIDRSYSYIKRSLEDALFCNAKLRTYEISKMLPIINEAYQNKNETNRRQLVVFLISVSTLSLFLLGVLVFLFKQMKKLRNAQKAIGLANSKLSELNNELNEINERLNQTNATLAEANLLKEIYIGRYMDQCSDYIAKLEEYSRKLHVMATAGKMNELVKAVKSNALIEKELRVFYSNFDQTFLQLFPTFIEEFKSLLTDKETIHVKPSELLNTELRIFALIRLGIKDSTKIAEFLRYSVSTIYNYRSQLKNKSLGPREEFESKVMLIGSSDKK